MRYEPSTRGIRVPVEPRYSPADSAPTGRTSVFSYDIGVADEGDPEVMH